MPQTTNHDVLHWMRAIPNLVTAFFDSRAPMSELISRARTASWEAESVRVIDLPGARITASESLATAVELLVKHGVLDIDGDDVVMTRRDAIAAAVAQHAAQHLDADANSGLEQLTRGLVEAFGADAVSRALNAVIGSDR